MPFSGAHLPGEAARRCGKSSGYTFQSEACRVLQLSSRSRADSSTEPRCLSPRVSSPLPGVMWQDWKLFHADGHAPCLPSGESTLVSHRVRARDSRHVRDRQVLPPGRLPAQLPRVGPVDARPQRRQGTRGVNRHRLPPPSTAASLHVSLYEKECVTHHSSTHTFHSRPYTQRIFPTLTASLSVVRHVM